ncbi:MAG: hypothetical protein MR836_02880 [Ruminococcus sp.]|nr:hypothetical protein [Ruminococcus sp.]CDF00845.1 putative uncharacterized protein [Ruminococcus sp. CAG:624]MDD6634521.1 hypothetical protein [Ruminococcus sp.]MDY3213970.1 hypothetical protein [Ruminococcus sp.]MDY3844907.1 hypothetical protein [Ruminococcus sp.]
MNPMAILQIKSLLDKFKNNHPKIPMFFSAAAQSIDENSIIEIKVTTAEGQNLITNMKVTSDDIELFKELKEKMMK